MPSFAFDLVCPACFVAVDVPAFIPKTIRELVIEARARLQLSQQAFAKVVGVTRAAVQQWERKGGTHPNPNRRRAVASAIGMSVAELMSGGPRPSASWNRRSVEVISRVEAGGFTQVDNFASPRESESVFVTVEVRQHTFALKVHGNSMRGRGEHSFPAKTIIVVEPELEAVPGDFVVVLDEKKRAAFKQLVLLDGVLCLKPLNSRFKTKPLGDGEIIGVVREAIMRLR